MFEPWHRFSRSRIVASAALCVAALIPISSASAQVDCSTLTNPVYGIGGSAPNVLLRRLGGALSRVPESNPDKVTVVYQSPGACSAMGALVNDIPLTGTATYWNASDEPQTCNVPQGTLASWGSMATLPTTCAGITELPATVGDYIGPVSAFSFIVPRSTTTEQVISSEALYFLYGFGPSGNVEPWTNGATIASRNITSAAGLLVAIAAGLPITRQLFLAGSGGWGTDVGNNQAAVNFVAGVSSPAAAADPGSAIGFASTETVELQDNITLVRQLAYQHVGQEEGYYPNSTPDSFDKQNVRDGHYYLWNPHHFYARQAAGVITDLPTRRWLSYVTGQTALPAQTNPPALYGNYLDIVINVGNVPDCAFTVTRTGDLGPLASYQPEVSCEGYFEATTTGETDHDECEDATDCTDSAFPVCNFGFCEVQ